MILQGVLNGKALIIKGLSVSYAASQALMPKRCKVLLETVKELPPLQVLEKKVKDYAMTLRLARKPVGVRQFDTRDAT